MPSSDVAERSPSRASVASDQVAERVVLLREVVKAMARIVAAETDERRTLAVAMALDAPDQQDVLNEGRARRTALFEAEADARGQIVQTCFAEHRTLMVAQRADHARAQHDTSASQRTARATMDRTATLGVLQLLAQATAWFDRFSKVERAERAWWQGISDKRRGVEAQEEDYRNALEAVESVASTRLYRGAYAERAPLVAIQDAFAARLVAERDARVQQTALELLRMQQFDDRVALGEDEAVARKTLRGVENSAWSDVWQLHRGAITRAARATLDPKAAK